MSVTSEKRTQSEELFPRIDIALKKSVLPPAYTKGTIVLPVFKPYLGTVVKKLLEAD